jgi:ribosomal protein L20
MERRWLKQIEDALEMHGITVNACDQGRKHAKLRIERDGIRGFVVVAVSPSDHRAIHNIVKNAKRSLSTVVDR